MTDLTRNLEDLLRDARHELSCAVLDIDDALFALSRRNGLPNHAKARQHIGDAQGRVPHARNDLEQARTRLCR